MKSISGERKTVSIMINRYCRDHHSTETLCQECREIEVYAFKRLEECTLSSNKPPCSKCSIHCYSEPFKTNIKKIMRYSGPRLLLTNPILSFIHLRQLLKFRGKIS